jgi:hypothetical protein
VHQKCVQTSQQLSNLPVGVQLEIKPPKVMDNIHGPMARISAFQADGSGSIPDGCNFHFLP